MIKYSDRIILKTIDNQIVVRPIASKDNCLIQYSNCCGILNDEGIVAWNNGDDIVWYHHSGFLDNLKILEANF